MYPSDFVYPLTFHLMPPGQSAASEQNISTTIGWFAKTLVKQLTILHHQFKNARPNGCKNYGIPTSLNGTV